MNDLADMRNALRSALRTGCVYGVLLTVAVSPAVARDAVTGGAPTVQPVPMTKLLQRVRETFPGRILTVDLDEGEGTDESAATYEVKVLTTGGDVLKLFYDAQTLRLEKILGRYRSDHEPRNAMGRDGGGSPDSGDDGRDDGASHDNGDDSGDSDDGSDGGSSDD